MLTDLGAQVIKVEPPAGDMTRFTYPRINSQSTYFVQQNVGKLNVSIDMDKPAGVELAARLIASADVVVENFRPGVMKRLGLDYERFERRVPTADLHVDLRVRGVGPLDIAAGLRTSRQR
ncbi:MAG: hypothetical protein EBQ75_01795 [Actinobacteria bacterium]|nr:hypothetical protein [Actinomycetota bacterium]